MFLHLFHHYYGLFSPIFIKKKPILAPLVTDAGHISFKVIWNLNFPRLLNNCSLQQIINALCGKCDLNDHTYYYLLLKSRQHGQAWNTVIILDTMLQERVLQNKKLNAREQQGSHSLYHILHYKLNKVDFVNYIGWYSTHLTSTIGTVGF